ncbi:hypothetical protein HHK36_015035 [Tetracentron sinense]|uniref:Uncharacterized protein n=1 Tax=Tetracentron sinense TaxID=13715 RepID=A0A834Z2A9_TETSI|nr:hypothetical protein HHK36_015035 [Tetracentron sinense]
MANGMPRPSNYLSDFSPKARVVRCNHEPQMFPSSNSNSDNPFPYTDQAMFGSRPFLGPNSKEEDPLSLSSFFPFPPPFLDHHDDHLLFPHLQPHQHLTLAEPARDSNQATMTKNKDVDWSKGDWDFLPSTKCYSTMTDQNIPRKRSGKKDRHTKINTLQGPRDRRMRLSVEIARKFFHLQDMLGFDKASKTVEWLLTKSKAAIKELARGFPHMKQYSCSAKSAVSSASECEVVSGIDETTSNGIVVSKGKSTLAGLPKEKKNRQSRKAAFHPLVKETREKARARARERTMKRRLHDQSKQCPHEASPQSLNQLRSSSPFETGEESASHNHDIKSCLPTMVTEEPPSSHSLDHQGPTQVAIEEALVNTSKLSPSSIFNYQHDIDISQGASSNNFLDFPENWGNIDGSRMHYSSYCAMTNMLLSTVNSQERIPSSNFLTSPEIRLPSQFAEFQFCG